MNKQSKKLVRVALGDTEYRALKMYVAEKGITIQQLVYDMIMSKIEKPV